ncbi:hypothetical protein [Glaciibacter psychrotolerans]|uniref:HK97 gp10 family phage protein n=1 Tax=Glaciibacter psychrotolerans TaxID=670054 RepID=A0A7Z0EH51_9MICO|nr:hypothetical protein [Leifsonia psychrotolerans]NYJ20807.1 hypothetical protein [Leifsonia psychrotolerans]
MSSRISVFNSKELQGVILLMKGLDRELAKQIRQVTKAMIEPEWKEAIASRASTPLEQRVLAATARVAVSDQNVTLKSAHIGKSLSGGLKPSEIVGGAEFGADQSKKTTYTATSSKGKKFKVTRRTQSQLRPRNKAGYVVMPAVANIIPRLASLWVQTTVRTFYELIEKR